MSEESDVDPSLGSPIGPEKSSIIQRRYLRDGLGSYWKFWKRQRIILTFLAFLGFINIYTNRIDLSIAITSMVKGFNNSEEGEFDWDSQTNAFVLSSFFYGYITLQFAGGWLANKYGGVKLFGFGVGVASFVSIFTQYFARAHYLALIFLRVVEGILQSVCLPCMHDVWAHWLPPLERNRLTAFAYSGSYVGAVLAMTVSGVLAKHVHWTAVFHLFGGLGALWYGIWLSHVYRIPDYDPYITNRELHYLRFHLDTELKKVKHPWKKIFTSPPVYALIIAHFSINWGTYTLLTQLPMYMQDVLNFDLTEAGFLAAVPYIILSCAMQFTGCVVDYILYYNIMTITKVRKLFICLGFIIEGGLLFSVGYLTSPILAVILLTLGVTCNGISEPNYLVNHLDIAPQHASVLMGITNTFATLPGMVSPILTEYLTPNQEVVYRPPQPHTATHIYNDKFLLLGSGILKARISVEMALCQKISLLA